MEASALQGVENYDPSSWLPAEALYLQLRSQTSSDLHLQLNEDVSINSLKLLRFVQRQPSGLPGGLVAYFIQGFFFFFFFLSAADTFDNQTVWGRGLLISEKG